MKFSRAQNTTSALSLIAARALPACVLPACALAALAACALAACAHGAANAKNPSDAPALAITITRVWPDYRTAESFDRISEYFTAAENTGGQIIMRTHPETRAGLYFFTRLKMQPPASPARALANAQVEISIITPASPDAKTYLLRIPAAAALRKDATAILLNPGLTGPDWPWTDAKTQPVAWCLRLLAADGTVLATQQSYLWSK